METSICRLVNEYIVRITTFVTILNGNKILLSTQFFLRFIWITFKWQNKYAGTICTNDNVEKEKKWSYSRFWMYWVHVIGWFQNVLNVQCQMKKIYFCKSTLLIFDGLSFGFTIAFIIYSLQIHSSNIQTKIWIHQ